MTEAATAEASKSRSRSFGRGLSVINAPFLPESSSAGRRCSLSWFSKRTGRLYMQRVDRAPGLLPQLYDHDRARISKFRYFAGRLIPDTSRLTPIQIRLPALVSLP
jgi:hypothetical protein